MMTSFLQLPGPRYDGFSGGGHSPRRIVGYVGISVVAHVLFFLVSIWLVQFESPRTLIEVVQVDLVSFAPGDPGGLVPTPAEPPPPPPDDPAPEPQDTAEKITTEPEVAIPETPGPPVPDKLAEPESIGTLKPAVDLKAKPENFKELMAAQNKKRQTPKPARQAKAEKEAVRQKEQLARAMDRLTQAVKEQDRKASDTSIGASRGTGGKGGTPLDFYKAVLQSTIQQNWVFNELLAGMDQNLEARILIKILKTGKIRDIVYETRSENRYLDQSAKRAIQRANPLPPLPKGMASYDVVVIFTPEGLR